MMKTNGRRVLLLLLVMVVAVSVIAIQAFAANYTPITGVTVSASGTTSEKMSNGVVTVTAKGSLLSKKTSTVTIYNETESVAELSFDYTADAASSFKIAGANANASGVYSAILNPGASVVITITSNSGLSNLTATLTLSNFSLTTAAASSNVTIDYDSTLGSVTAAGSAVTSGTTVEATLTDGVELTATANSGVTFLGWIDTADNSIIDKNGTYLLKPSADITVKPVFATNGGIPWFGVGKTTQKSVGSGLLGLSKLYYYEVSTSYLFDDLNAAGTFAASSGNTAMVLMNNATLPSGTYTIPANVSLLIPFDANNKMYTTQIEQINGTKDANITRTTYRTLTLAEGANIVVNGALNLSAKQNCMQGSYRAGGAPVGGLSFVQMAENSTITINNGGALYAYGFITGSGSVVANSGATVYEMFQATDFRGGTQSTDDKMKQHHVFPLSQYYVQNIEVPLTLYSGASEYAYSTVYMSKADFGTSVKFIAKTGAMFNLTSGYVVKDYDEATDRLVVEAYGEMEINGITMEIGTSDIDSSDYVLPINSNITVRVMSGSFLIDQDVALLPGAEIYVAEGCTCTLAEGTDIYIYDADEWGGYAGPQNSKLTAVLYAPGRTYTRTEADLVDAKIVIAGTMDASKGYVYTTAGGANITAEGSTAVVITNPGTAKIVYQMIQKSGDVASVYVEVPVTTAKLLNPDGTYLTTCKGTYTSNNAVWRAGADVAHTFSDTVVAPTCESGGYTKHECTACGYYYCDEDTAALGHTEAAIGEAKDATCTEPGTTAGTKCSTCGLVFAEQTQIPAKGHTPGEPVKENIVAADCTNPGSYDMVRYCSVCNAKTSSETVTVDALGHTEVTDAAVPATCTTTGLTEGKHCSVCNAVIVAQTETAALGHTETIDAAVPATCTTTGLTEGKHCSVCGETTVAQTEVAALGHTWNTATCTTPKTCSVCGATEGAAAGHTAGEPVKENETASSYDEVVYCTVCKTELSRKPVVTHTHALTLVDAKAPTYGTAGNTAYYVCDCGKYFADEAGENEIAEGSWIIAALAAGKDTTALVIKPTSSNTAATLMLGADLKLSFNVAVKSTTAYDSIFLEITKLGVTTEVELYNKTSTNHTFRYTLAAPEMTAEMKVVVCGIKDGKVYAGDPITFTYKDIVVDKMNAFYNGTNEKNKVEGCALLANLLKYGEEAQKRFNISTDNLATDGLPDIYKAMINTAAPTLDTWVKPAKTTYYLVSYTPMLQEQIKIAFTFAVPSYTSLEGYEVKIVQTMSKDGSVVTHTFGADKLINTSATRIRCDFAIAGAEGRDNLAITLYKDGVAVSETVNTNLGALAQGKQSDALNPLLYAMMNYCDAAKAFFG